MLLTGSISNGATLSIDVDSVTGEVRAVGGDGLVAESLAKSIVGLTLDQAAIDGADRVLRRTAGDGIPPVAGILSITNAGKQYLELDAALGRLLRHYRDIVRDPVSRRMAPREEEWDCLGQEEQIRRLTAATAGFEELAGMKRGTVTTEALERDVSGRSVRLVVAVSSEFGSDGVPRLIRKLERHVREAVGQQIEVLVDERQDRNKLRRAILVKEVSAT